MDKNVYPIIGMSPGNSYFKDAEVEYLLKETIARYGKTAILIADIPAIATYIAYGYPENRARNKAIPKGNNLKNRVSRLSDQLGIIDKVKIIDWEHEVERNGKFQDCFNELKNLYNINETFSQSVNDTTRSVLETANRQVENLDSAVRIATHYLLSELAFLEFAPEFLSANQVVYIYHRNWPVYERYISGAFDGKIRTYLEFLLLENPRETYRPLSSSEQMNRISSDKLLRCSFSNYPPGFIEDEKTGSFSGIFYDLITKFANEHGWKIEWSEETGYGVIAEGLEAGRFDIFVAPTWPIPERLNTIGFSESVYKSEVCVWVREQDKVAASNPNIKDNTFFRVAIKENDISDSIANKDFPNWRKVRVPQLTDTEELLQFVADGDADATFVEPYLAEKFNVNSPVKLVNIAKQPIRIFENSFSFAHDATELKKLLDKFIITQKENGTVKMLLGKYANEYSNLGISI